MCDIAFVDHPFYRLMLWEYTQLQQMPDARMEYALKMFRIFSNDDPEITPFIAQRIWLFEAMGLTTNDIEKASQKALITMLREAAGTSRLVTSTRSISIEEATRHLVAIGKTNIHLLDVLYSKSDPILIRFIIWAVKKEILNGNKGEYCNSDN